MDSGNTLFGFLKYGYSKSSKSLDHYSIETHGDLGITHLKNPPTYNLKFRNYGG